MITRLITGCHCCHSKRRSSVLGEEDGVGSDASGPAVESGGHVSPTDRHVDFESAPYKATPMSDRSKYVKVPEVQVEQKEMRIAHFENKPIIADQDTGNSSESGDNDTTFHTSGVTRYSSDSDDSDKDSHFRQFIPRIPKSKSMPDGAYKAVGAEPLLADNDNSDEEVVHKAAPRFEVVKQGVFSNIFPKSSSAIGISTITPPISPPHGEDIFSAAPFKKKSSSLQRGQKLLPSGGKGEDDPFAQAPFRLKLKGEVVSPNSKEKSSRQTPPISKMAAPDFLKYAPDVPTPPTSPAPQNNVSASGKGPPASAAQKQAPLHTSNQNNFEDSVFVKAKSSAVQEKMFPTASSTRKILPSSQSAALPRRPRGRRPSSSDSRGSSSSEDKRSPVSRRRDKSDVKLNYQKISNDDVENHSMQKKERRHKTKLPKKSKSRQLSENAFSNMSFDNACLDEEVDDTQNHTSVAGGNRMEGHSPQLTHL